MKNKIFVAIVFFIMLGLFSFGSVFAKPPIKVQLEQTKLKFKAELFTKYNTIMVPARDIAEALGAQVNWDNKTKTVFVKKDKMSIEFKVGKDIAYIHRQDDFTGIPEKCKLTAPVMTVKKTTFVPLRFIAERLGYEVSWNNDTRTVIIKRGISGTPIGVPVNFTVVDFDSIKNSTKLRTWYEANYHKKGIYKFFDGKTVYVLASAGMKPTGGYSVKINKISLVNNQTAVVEADVTSPSPDAMVTQAITYPSLLVKIAGYNIRAVEGVINDKSAAGTDEGAEKTFGDTVIKYKPEAVKSMELKNLEGTKIKDFKPGETTDIINALNKSKISDLSYIEMLAGNSIYTTMADGSTINFWSYGSKTNFIAVIKAGEKYNSYHLVSPFIAELLLSK